MPNIPGHRGTPGLPSGDYGYPWDFMEKGGWTKHYAELRGICNPNSPHYNRAECERRRGGAGGAGGDWWSSLSQGEEPKTNYEAILNSLYKRSVLADPQQEAIGFGADVLSGTNYDEILKNLHSAVPGAGKQAWSRGDPARYLGRSMASAGGQKGVSAKSPQTQNLGFLSSLMSQINQTLAQKSGTFAGAAGGALGPATSMVSTGYRGLQGFRGQDMGRYMGEMDAQIQLQIAKLMAKARAASQDGGGGIWEILSGLAGFIPYVGDIMDLFDGGETV